MDGRNSIRVVEHGRDANPSQCGLRRALAIIVVRALPRCASRMQIRAGRVDRSAGSVHEVIGWVPSGRLIGGLLRAKDTLLLRSERINLGRFFAPGAR